MGIRDFDVRVPAVEEICPDSIVGAERVCYLSRLKAEAAQPLVTPEDIVIAADTLVLLDGQMLGKPKDEANALAMLSMLSGREHEVCTGVTVSRNGQYETESATTYVRFRSLTEQELLSYIRTGEPMDKAGAYGIQGLGSLLVEGIRGDFYNVVGLPVPSLCRLLSHMDYPLL